MFCVILVSGIGVGRLCYSIILSITYRYIFFGENYAGIIGTFITISIINSVVT